MARRGREQGDESAPAGRLYAIRNEQLTGTFGLPPAFFLAKSSTRFVIKAPKGRQPVKETKNLTESMFPLFVDPKTSWSGTTFTDEGPFFRQLPAIVHHNDAGHEKTDSERRGAARRELQLGVEVYGYDGDLSLIHAYGTTDNVSASGMFAFVDIDLPIGSRAVVAIRPSHPALEPRILRGKVVRCAQHTNGYGLAIHFDLDVQRFAAEAA
jgi:hypothetical protein